MSTTEIPQEIVNKIKDEAERLYPYKEATVFKSGEIGIRERNKVDSDRMKFRSNATFGYSLSQQERDELRKEVAELKTGIDVAQEMINEYKEEIIKLKGIIKQ